MLILNIGEDGLEELVDDFNPSKIQYAFLKVEDPKTSLPKFVLINWQVLLSRRRAICNSFTFFLSRARRPQAPGKEPV